METVTIFRKPPGQKWHICTLPGLTESWLDEKVQAEWDTEFGIVIYHEDAKKTMKIIPQHAICSITSYGDNEFRNDIKDHFAYQDEIAEVELLELER